MYVGFADIYGFFYDPVFRTLVQSMVWKENVSDIIHKLLFYSDAALIWTTSDKVEDTLPNPG